MKYNIWNKKRKGGEEGFSGSGKDFAFRKNMLFESLREKLESYPELNSMLYSLLFMGKAIV